MDQALYTGKITAALHTPEIALEDFAKEKKTKKEDDTKGWCKRIEIVSDNLNKINTSSIELKKESDVALDEITLTTMQYTAVVAFLFAVQVFLDAQRWWLLFIYVMLMFFGIIVIAIKAGLDLRRIGSQMKELCEEQNLLYETGKSLIADLRLAQPKSDFRLELKAEIREFDKFISSIKRVRKLSWTYWANFIIFSVLWLAVAILFRLNLDVIAKRDPLADARAPAPSHAQGVYQLHNS